MKSKVLTDSIANSLSPLESSVFQTLLKYEKPLSTQDVYTLIRKTRQTAKTSVIVALDRLHTNGIVTRKTETCRGGVRYLYLLATTRKEFEKAVIEKTVNTLVENFGSAARAYFKEKFKG